MKPRSRCSAQIVAKPTNVRYGVLGYACALSVITYLDRICISGAAPAIREEMGLSPVEMGFVFSAFVLGYSALQVPGGWLGDKLGPRKVLTWIVVWWSAFTALTGGVRTLGLLVAARFLFGAGQAGAFPITARSFSNWFPATEVGFAQGLMWMSARLGGALAPGLIVLMMARLGWRLPFVIFGLVGVIWAFFFYPWYRDRPEEKPSVNEAEREVITGARRMRHNQDDPTPAKVPWGKLLRSENLWTICLMYFCLAFGWFFYLTWLPTYLQSRGMTLTQAGLYAGLPLFLGAFGCLGGGVLTDYVVRRTGKLKNRRYIGFGGFTAGALCLLASAYMPDPRSAVLCMALAAFFSDITMGSCWAVCIDIGHELAGTVSGCMNTWGSVGALLSPVFAGYVVQHLGAWQLVIVSYAAVLFLGALFWLRIDSTRPLLK